MDEPERVMVEQAMQAFKYTAMVVGVPVDLVYALALLRARALQEMDTCLDMMTAVLKGEENDEQGTD